MVLRVSWFGKGFEFGQRGRQRPDLLQAQAVGVEAQESGQVACGLGYGLPGGVSFAFEAASKVVGQRKFNVEILVVHSVAVVIRFRCWCFGCRIHASRVMKGWSLARA